MKGQKITLSAGSGGILAPGGVGGRTILIKTALTDLVLGGTGVTSATGYATAAALSNVSVQVGANDLVGISTAGGDVFVLDPENT